MLKIFNDSPIFLKYLFPTNLEKEKTRFLKNSSISSPAFRYSKLQYNPKEIIERLENIKIDTDDILTELYNKKIQAQISKQNIVLNRNDPKIALNFSIKAYGQPNIKTYKTAVKALKNHKENQNKLPKNISDKQIKEFFESKLKSQNLKRWSVRIKNLRSGLSVDGDQQLIIVAKGVKYNLERVKSLYHHEIEGHVFRAVNAKKQPLLIFQGFPDSTETEEGIAIYLEKVNNTTKPTSLSKERLTYAVKKLIEGQSFRKTYNGLRNYNFNEDEAFKTCLRVYRGGGFTKDYVYLQGYLRVKQFLEKGGEFKRFILRKIRHKTLAYY